LAWRGGQIGGLVLRDPAHHHGLRWTGKERARAELERLVAAYDGPITRSGHRVQVSCQVCNTRRGQRRARTGVSAALPALRRGCEGSVVIKQNTKQTKS
jgi:hypothetical protein